MSSTVNLSSLEYGSGNATTESLYAMSTERAAPPPRTMFSRPPDLISSEVATDVSDAIYCYILPILVIFGSVGNLMSIIVLCVEKKRDTTNMSLTALAISDTGYILTTFASYRYTYRMTTAISLLTQFINSSINFVVYMAMNERFSKTYVEVFRCKDLMKNSLEETKSGETKTATTKVANTTLAVPSTSGAISSDGTSIDANNAEN